MFCENSNVIRFEKKIFKVRIVSPPWYLTARISQDRATAERVIFGETWSENTRQKACGENYLAKNISLILIPFPLDMNLRNIATMFFFSSNSYAGLIESEFLGYILRELLLYVRNRTNVESHSEPRKSLRKCRGKTR